MPETPPPQRPLLVTADAGLLDELLRLCAAAGVEAEVATEVATARAGWATAPLVVLGSDVARAGLDQGLAGRRGVVLVGLDLDASSAWAMATDLGADSVVGLPESQGWLVDRLGRTVDGEGPGGVVLAVVGGRGGAGASTLAAALGMTAGRSGLRTMLVDGDPLGGGLDLLLGGEDSDGLRWPALAGAGGRVNGEALRDSLPTVAGARSLNVLSWDRSDTLAVPAAAMSAVLSAGRRSSDVTVVDLPRHVDSATEVALTAAQVVLLVVPAEVRATASAARVATALGLLAPDLRVVVRGPAPAGLTAAVVGDALGLPLAGWLRSEPGLSTALDRGQPPARSGRGPLAHFCQQLLDELVPAPGRVA